ncbi:hypothetical protein An09g02300 [Aspergillus niger]|uniref:Uncharacterized protein n=2 Tax=Aspergillus niger TaxID=5061 RepID=A2QTJ2_ASPNC|nr:hypothetical protein An09g02300 [Aspergillus niger]CAK40167.1 hypothetical protein An09g02300 [Aspergillus niger]
MQYGLRISVEQAPKKARKCLLSEPPAKATTGWGSVAQKGSTSAMDERGKEGEIVAGASGQREELINEEILIRGSAPELEGQVRRRSARPGNGFGKQPEGRQRERE